VLDFLLPQWIVILFLAIANADATSLHGNAVVINPVAVAMFLLPVTGYIAVTHLLGITSCCNSAMTLLPLTLHHHCDACYYVTVAD